MIHLHPGPVNSSTDTLSAPNYCFDDTLYRWYTFHWFSRQKHWYSPSSTLLRWCTVIICDTQWNQYTPQGNMLCHLVYTIQYTARLSYFTWKWTPSHWGYKRKQYTFLDVKNLSSNANVFFICADLTDLSKISPNWISKIKLQCTPGRPERPGAISSTGYSHRLPHNSHRKHSLSRKFVGICIWSLYLYLCLYFLELYAPLPIHTDCYSHNTTHTKSLLLNRKFVCKVTLGFDLLIAYCELHLIFISHSSEFCGFPLNAVHQGVSACMWGRATVVVKFADESCWQNS